MSVQTPDLSHLGNGQELINRFDFEKLYFNRQKQIKLFTICHSLLTWNHINGLFFSLIRVFKWFILNVRALKEVFQMIRFKKNSSGTEQNVKQYLQLSSVYTSLEKLLLYTEVINIDFYWAFEQRTNYCFKFIEI